MKLQKGLCVKMNNGRSFFLIEDGRFIEGRAVGAIDVGEEGFFVPASSGFNLALPKILIPIAAFAAAVILLFTTMLPSEEAYAYVQLEVNPGIEFGIDEDIQVISVRELNGDGKALIERLGEWKGHTLDEILARSISLAATSAADTVTITMVAENLSKKTAAPVEKSVMAVSKAALHNDIKIHLKKATLDQWRKSVKEDVPVGQKVKKYTPVLKEEKIDPSKGDGNSRNNIQNGTEGSIKKLTPSGQGKKEILPQPKKEPVPPIRKEKVEPSITEKDSVPKKHEKQVPPKAEPKKAPEKVIEKKNIPVTEKVKVPKQNKVVKPEKSGKQSSGQTPSKNKKTAK